MKSCMSGNKAQITVVACVNAIGQAIPPYAIYNAKTLNPEWMKDGPPGTKCDRLCKNRPCLHLVVIREILV